MPDPSPLTVIKRGLQGQELWRYPAMLLRRQGTALHLQATFNATATRVAGTLINPGDLFLETFYTDRWYNLFEIHDALTGALKGWYCNIGRPAVLESENTLAYIDLALDLWVSPDGTQVVLDEDEFAALPLDPATRTRARQALTELRRLFALKENPGTTGAGERF